MKTLWFPTRWSSRVHRSLHFLSAAWIHQMLHPKEHFIPSVSPFYKDHPTHKTRSPSQLFSFSGKRCLSTGFHSFFSGGERPILHFSMWDSYSLCSVMGITSQTNFAPYCGSICSIRFREIFGILNIYYEIYTADIEVNYRICLYRKKYVLSKRSS